MRPFLRTTSALVLLLSLGTSFRGNAPALEAQEPPADLDRYVESVMERFQVPGLGLAIVKDGRTVLARGYGVKSIRTREPVGANTGFAIASNTKAFTATALALLVEEGMVEWDARVVDYLPWFRMSDPYVTAELTVRDLLVHRSGLPLGGGDLLWWPPTDYTRDEIVRRIRHVPLATSFRSAYAYDNVLYLVAGELIEAVSGESWETFVESRIVRPVGMSGAAVRHSSVHDLPDVAVPHNILEGELRVVDPFTSDNVNPAGGIVAGARDMARWLIVQMDSGRVAGSDGAGSDGRLFQPSTTRELWGPVTPIPLSDPPPGFPRLRRNFRSYALGFRIQDYMGRKVVTHTGGLPGFLSRVTMVPDQKLGIVVLTNMMSGEAFEAVTYRIMDHYLGLEEFDWLGAYEELMARRDSAMVRMERGAAAARDAESRPSLGLDEYAGTYRDAWYGEVEVRREGAGLVMDFTHTPSLLGDLEHWQHDTFVVHWRDLSMFADAYVTFQLGPDGTIQRVLMEPVSPAVDFSFDFQHLELRPVEDD